MEKFEKIFIQWQNSDISGTQAVIDALTLVSENNENGPLNWAVWAFVKMIANIHNED